MTAPGAAREDAKGWVTLCHDYVSPACVHRHHGKCDNGCRYCVSKCLCVCHRWAIAVKTA